MSKREKTVAPLIILPISLFFAVASLANAGETQESVPQVDLAIKTDQGYLSVDEYVVPEGHTIGDGSIAYEGVGIESENVGYRIYLDERSVLDVFGKRTNAPVLQNVGRGDDYHALADWGMDILKVGESLGSGGLGIYQDGRMHMVGPARELVVTVTDKGPDLASFTVTHEGLVSTAGEYGLNTKYSMSRQSRLLTVQAQSTGHAPILAAGLVIHPGTTNLSNPGDGQAGWAYLATYGLQSLAGDRLGLALFYQPGAILESVDDGHTLGVTFNRDQPVHYHVAAAWEAELGGLPDIETFKSYLQEELKRLEQNTTP